MKIFDSNGYHCLESNGIIVRPHVWIQNPEVYASLQAFQFLHDMLNEREKLIAVLKEARLSIALEDKHVNLGEFTAMNVLREVVAKCADIKTGE